VAGAAGSAVGRVSRRPADRPANAIDQAELSTGRLG